ncbi:hypothetical protein DSO57_1035386 [Entomophthora muscae]|uniref:Uncharacterized protein n=1 Tax=Entomophthora muscae TaxID=34485 RepID=A0ACC2RQJ2_9FUNG|nr:hypothetical protein DSO57_1035386 [Entomophthora muscae]
MSKGLVITSKVPFCVYRDHNEPPILPKHTPASDWGLFQKTSIYFDPATTTCQPHTVNLLAYCTGFDTVQECATRCLNNSNVPHDSIPTVHVTGFRTYQHIHSCRPPPGVKCYVQIYKMEYVCWCTPIDPKHLQRQLMKSHVII